jgi:hypothetical protein
MPPSVILYTATIESVFGGLQVGKMELEDEHVVEERLTLPSYHEKPEMMVVGLTYRSRDRGNMYLLTQTETCTYSSGTASTTSRLWTLSK